MRNLLLYFNLFILFLGCSVDDLPSCEGNGNEGEICKEFQYVGGRYNGFNEYYYDESGAVLLSKITRSKSGSKGGSVFYSYNNYSELVEVEYINYLGDVVRVKTFKYDADGRIVEKDDSGDINEKVIYQYANGLLQNIIYMQGDIVASQDSLEYFTNTSNLYRTIKYSGGILSLITYDVWFGNSMLKQTVYDTDGNKKSSVVSRYNSNKVLTEKIDYNTENNIEVREVYSYTEGYLIEVIKEDGSGIVFEKLVYQRF